jgi:cytochrome c biogenesis protein CcmG/thiol:disulfide interchange protein DsbE
MPLDRSRLSTVATPGRSAAGMLGLVLALVQCGSPAFPASSSHPLLGRPLPEIRHRQSVDGRPLQVGVGPGADSGSAPEGPVLVKFFADYCQPCKTTLPAAERIHEEYPDVAFVGIDEDETTETARDLARRYGLTFPVVHDSGNVLAGRFRVSAMPATFVADASGVIRWVGAEGQTEDQLRQAVRASRSASSR